MICRRPSVLSDTVTYSILVKASCNAKKVDGALSLFQQLRRVGMAFGEAAFNTLLECSKAARLAEAEDILQEMQAFGMARHMSPYRS